MKAVTRFIVVVAVLSLFLGLSTPIPAIALEKVNINTASAEELAQLKRIGPKYAARIIEFRETNGPFKLSEDIMKVKGIGQKTWEVNKDRIVVE